MAKDTVSALWKTHARSKDVVAKNVGRNVLRGTSQAFVTQKEFVNILNVLMKLTVVSSKFFVFEIDV